MRDENAERKSAYEKIEDKKLPDEKMLLQGHFQDSDTDIYFHSARFRLYRATYRPVCRPIYVYIYIYTYIYIYSCRVYRIVPYTVGRVNCPCPEQGRTGPKSEVIFQV